MFGTTPCPDKHVLAQLVLGRLGADETEALACHLERCGRCAATAQSLAAEDTLVAAARAPAAAAEDGEDSVVAALIARLSGLPAAPDSGWPDEAEAPAGPDLMGMLSPPREAGELGRLGPYRVLRVLGAGGMGVVFQAEDRALRRLVALKTLKPDLADSGAARHRFLREAQAAAAVTHDHVVTIHQVGEHHGVPYLAMQLLCGESLERRLRRAEAGEEPLPLAEVVRVGREIAQGLAAAHECGLVHRDVKPANVWLEEGTGRVKLLDFGLSRALDEETFLTEPGTVAGTPAYLAPEVLTGLAVDGRCDLFSLGCVLYRMLTGLMPSRAPARLRTVPGTAFPASPRALNRAVPPALADLVLRLLARDPAGRPRSAGEVADALRQIEGRGAGRAAAPGRRGRRRLALAAGLTVVGLGMGLFFYLMKDRGAGAPPTGPARTSAEQWAAGVAALPPEARAAAVAARLKELNPHFDGSFNQRQAGDTVVEFHVLTDHVTDISPVRALAALEILVCRGSEPGKGMLTDLSPLKGLKPVYLDCSENRDLTDLSPLRGMPLEELSCWSTSVSDLRPLRGMPLTHLDCNMTFVADLRPLEGMSLRRLSVKTIFSPDLTPVAGMPLQELDCEFRPGRDARLLRPCKTLQRINGQPAEEFWNDVRARRNDVHAFIKHVATLPVEQQGQAVAAKLREYNPRFDGQVRPTIQDGAVVELRLLTDRVKDLRPLRALPQLRRLVCRATERGGESLFDLAPLNELPLTFLDCGWTNVADLSPLRKMRLGGLACQETLVRDLSPLAGQPLTYLDCSATDVSDLAPLKGMPLLHLRLRGSRVMDLSPLQGLPLREIACDFEAERDADVLRSIKTLETINDLPAREFWDRAAAGGAARLPP
jgi:hypothetical protein